MERKYDCIIIGGGPAGATAAVYIKRANLTAAVIYRDGGAVSHAAEIENYYGISSISGIELFEKGLENAAAFGAEVIRKEATDVSYDGEFIVTAGSVYRAKALILATGSARSVPKIKGIDRFEGSGVSSCAVCDGFFFRGKDVCVVGSGEYAKAEAEHLSAMCKSVSVYTDGKEPETDFSPFPVGKTKIAEITGEQKVDGVVFSDGQSAAVSGVFLAIGTASASDLARKLGAEVNKSGIVVDSDMKTAVPGLFAAGDCTGGIRQISVAVGQGATAALSAVRLLRS